MNKNDKTAERKIDKEIARRAAEIHVCYIEDIADMIRNMTAITIVSSTKINYEKVWKLLYFAVVDPDMCIGDISPGDMKRLLIKNGYTGISVCDHRDQYSRQEGRTRAKRTWLKAHPYRHPIVKKFRELRKIWIMKKCSYCDAGTDSYFEVGNPDRPLRIQCCEKCYDTLIRPLSAEQRRTLVNLAMVVIYQDIPCDIVE